MTIVQLDIDPRQFQDDLETKITTSVMQSLPTLIINLVVEQLEQKLGSLVTSGEILRFKIDCIRSSLTSIWPPLTPLPLFLKNLPKQTIFDLGCFAVTIAVKHYTSPEIYLKQPVNLQCLQPIEVKQQPLKTVCKYIIRMRQVGLQANILAPVISNTLISSCNCSPDCLAAHTDGAWDWALRFICKICGKSHFCECFRTALEKNYLKALTERSHYGEDGWPHKFIASYQQSEFREGICHLCRDIPSDLFYCHPMYGSKVMIHYGPYIKRTAIEKDIDEREAENEIRESLGIPRISEGWISEIELLNIVKDILPNKKVVHQASPDWLRRQRLDIFIPELKLAIEYQGQQHYKSVPLFGGEEGFLQTQKRDKLKAKLCAENGISLIFFRYDETVTRKLVEARIKKTLLEKA